MKYKVNDIIYLSSPRYKVKCRARVIHVTRSGNGESHNVSTVEPLNAAFNHPNFKKTGQHQITQGDKVMGLCQPITLPEDLFTI